MNDEQALRLGAYIRHRREVHNLSIRQLATRAGLDDRGLGRLECGKVYTPRPATLAALAIALEASLADLFVMAGYTVPQDLPSVEPYLRTKYSALHEEDIIAISREVEGLTQRYTT